MSSEPNKFKTKNYKFEFTDENYYWSNYQNIWILSYEQEEIYVFLKKASSFVV